MDQTEKKLDEILDRGIRPHALEIAAIISRGHIAVCVLEPSRKTLDCLESWGWKGEPVFRMTTPQRLALARTCADYGDNVGARWVSAKKRNGRIFVFCEDGTCLVNFEAGKGYSLEPGSTDLERRKQHH